MRSCRVHSSALQLKEPYHAFVRVFLAQMFSRTEGFLPYMVEMQKYVDPPLESLFATLEERGAIAARHRSTATHSQLQDHASGLDGSVGRRGPALSTNLPSSSSTNAVLHRRDPRENTMKQSFTALAVLSPPRSSPRRRLHRAQPSHPPLSRGRDAHLSHDRRQRRLALHSRRHRHGEEERQRQLRRGVSLDRHDLQREASHAATGDG